MLQWAGSSERKTARLTDGQAGRVAATLQKVGIGGCGLAAPSIDEGEPALVRRALVTILYGV